MKFILSSKKRLKCFIIKIIKNIFSKTKFLCEKNLRKKINPIKISYVIQPSAMFGNLICEIIWVKKHLKNYNYLGICAQAGSYNPFIEEIFGNSNDLILNPYYSFKFKQRRIQFGNKDYYYKLWNKFLNSENNRKPVKYTTRNYYDQFWKIYKKSFKNAAKELFFINKKYWKLEKKSKRIFIIKKKFLNYSKKIELFSKKQNCVVLYLRQKNYNSSEEKIRNGSPLENYNNLFENHLNFSFFLVGDYSFDEFQAQPNVFYSKKLKIPDRLFSIIIWYFCSKFICEPGGPACFPILLGKPFLLLNYPWFDVPIPGALITYKEIKVNHGETQIKLPDWNGGIQYSERLKKAGIQLKENDSDIITDSFKEYLQLTRSKKIGPNYCVSKAWKRRHCNLNIKTSLSSFFGNHQMV